MALIAACVGVDLVTRVEGSIGSYFMFVPKLSEQEPYRFLASAFVHASFWHLLLNMYVLWVFGSVLEPAIGHARYLGIYLLSAVAGNAAVILTADPLGNSWFTATVGASGAVFGLLGAQLVVARVSGADLTGFLVFIALNAVISLSPDSGISWRADSSRGRSPCTPFRGRAFFRPRRGGSSTSSPSRRSARRWPSSSPYGATPEDVFFGFVSSGALPAKSPDCARPQCSLRPKCPRRPGRRGADLAGVTSAPSCGRHFHPIVIRNPVSMKPNPINRLPLPRPLIGKLPPKM